MADLGLKTTRIEIFPEEASKNIHACLEVIEELIALGAGRTSALIALGGGAWAILSASSPTSIIDIPYVLIPKTLLAQVNSFANSAGEGIQK